MKRKTLTLCLSLLACLSLIGVGFAAWVISGGDSQDADGTITVDTVTDGRFTVSKPTITENIYYGMDLQASAADETPWLKNDNDEADEKLVVTFDVTVTAASEVAAATEEAWEAAVSVSAVIAAIEKDAWTAAKTAQVVADPEVSVEFKSATDTKNAVYTVTITAKWGELFTLAGKVVNPYLFYNDNTKDVAGKCGVAVGEITAENATWGDHASYYLGLVQALANTQYKVTITVAAI